MAITLTVAQLAAAARIGATPEETAEVTRLLGYATEAISNYLGASYSSAPEIVVNEAAIRVASYLYDQPQVSRGDGFANAMRNSGAARMLLPYRVHRAGSTVEAQVAAIGTGTVDNPVTDVTVNGDQLVVSFADGTTDSHTLPAGMGGSTPMPATPAEAAGGTSTAIRSWTAALIRAAVNAVVPTWAREGNTDPIPAPKLANAPSGGVGGLSITDLGSYTTTAQTASGDVQDTGIASPDTGLFLIVTIGGEEDVLWFNRAFVHDNSGTPIPGGATNQTVYVSSARAIRMGKTVGGNFAITNAFASTLLLAGTKLTFAVVG